MLAVNEKSTEKFNKHHLHLFKLTPPPQPIHPSIPQALVPVLLKIFPGRVDLLFWRLLFMLLITTRAASSKPVSSGSANDTTVIYGCLI
jgi:hypothetical protein